jgi:molybdopterin molybdotransferase
MITVSEADRLLRQNVFGRDVERVPLSRAAGRTLAVDVAADRPYPPFERVAMDGIAISAGAWGTGSRHFQIAATQRAGEKPLSLSEPQACIEIMTGAALPDGADAVIRYEDLSLDNGTAAVAEEIDVRPWQNVHRLGSDCAAGDVVLRSEMVIGPAEIAVLASIGQSEVTVYRRPRVAIVCTGDELVEVGAAVLPHQIRQSNGHAVRAALTLHGMTDVSLEQVPDDGDSIERALGDALDTADVLLISGGVSAGRYDLVPGILDELGVSEVFHKIRQRPGKPLWFGRSADGRPVFGLPGNPVSALVCVYRYVLPHILGTSGETNATLTLSHIPRRRAGFTLFAPVRREGLHGIPVQTNGSGDFLSVAGTDGFVEIGPDVSEPETVPFISWRGAL